MFNEDSDDSEDEGLLGNVNRQIMRPVGHTGKAKKGHLCFDASFECGNLGRVDLINDYEYDLFIRPDTCNPKFRFWFNFTVDNVKLDQKVIFNIVNISKERNLFMENLTPLVKSTSRTNWQRIPKEYVFYYKSNHHQRHYILSFLFSFDKEEEIFQFALAPPYSYSKLQLFLTNLEKKAVQLKDTFSRELFSKSVLNRKVDLLTIGSRSKALKSKNKKRIIFIMARIHPGETPSSYVCQGLLELLISSNAIATILRENIVFKVIPMLNPDGVFLGNYRSTTTGQDLNRSWHIANQWLHPTITSVISLLKSFDSNNDFQIDFIIDIHAHPNLTGCFMYGNSYENVYRYERHILFPKLLATIADDYVSENTLFNSDSNKIGTSHRFLCSLLSDKVNCYSFHVSFFGYKLNENIPIIPYTENSYMRCGRNLLKSFLVYYVNIGTIPVQLTAGISSRQRKHGNKRSLKHKHRLARKHKHQHYPLQTLPLANIDLNMKCSFDTNEENQPTLITTVKENMKNDKDSINPTTTFLVIPEPKLTVIDFNRITRIDIGGHHK